MAEILPQCGFWIPVNAGKTPGGLRWALLSDTIPVAMSVIPCAVLVSGSVLGCGASLPRGSGSPAFDKTHLQAKSFSL